MFYLEGLKQPAADLRLIKVGPASQKTPGKI